VYGEYGRVAADDVYVDYFQALPPSASGAVCGFRVCYSGPESGADAALAPLRKVGTPIVDSIEAMDYVALQRSGDVDDPRAQGSYQKGGFVTELPADLARAIAAMEGDPSRNSILFFQHAGGAIGRVSADATSFPNRDAFGNMMCAVAWPFGDERGEHVAYLRDYWSTLEPFTKGFYTNDLDPELSAGAVSSNWGGGYERLVRLKNEYDPTNLFRLNANVRPS